MATLASDKPRSYSVSTEMVGAELPVIASDIIYEGAAVGESSSTGTYRPLVAGDTFNGFAESKADNSSGAASAINVKVKRHGTVIIPVTGVSATAQVGDTVYASDDDTFTTTASGNSAVGKVQRWISSTTAEVYFEGATVRSI